MLFVNYFPCNYLKNEIDQRNVIVKSCDPSKFLFTKRQFVRYYDKNLSGCKSEPSSVIFLFSNMINLSTTSQNRLESHDFTIPLRSDRNQALGLLLCNWDDCDDHAI